MLALLVVLNIWPRASLLICFACFLSFVAAAQDFSGYKSDGMLLEAGFLARSRARGNSAGTWSTVLHRARATSFCNGSGFAFTSNLAS